jgi:hypothetical protein
MLLPKLYEFPPTLKLAGKFHEKKFGAKLFFLFETQNLFRAWTLIITVRFTFAVLHARPHKQQSHYKLD